MTSPKLEKAKQGICPYCGKGPFVIVAQHVSAIHGLDRFAFRDDIGAYYSDTLTDLEWHEQRAAWARGKYRDGEFGIEPGHTKRKRRAKRYAQDLRRRGSEQIRYVQEKRARERAALVELYESGRSVYEIAEAEGSDVKSVRGRLRAAGVDVPDGRADPDRPRRTNYQKQPPWYCSRDGCDREGHARGLCHMHYQREQAKRKREGKP